MWVNLFSATKLVYKLSWIKISVTRLLGLCIDMCRSRFVYQLTTNSLWFICRNNLWHHWQAYRLAVIPMALILSMWMIIMITLACSSSDIYKPWAVLCKMRIFLCSLLYTGEDIAIIHQQCSWNRNIEKSMWKTKKGDKISILNYYFEIDRLSFALTVHVWRTCKGYIARYRVIYLLYLHVHCTKYIVRKEASMSNARAI